MSPSLSVVILAAGRGTRMKSSVPKVLFDVCGITSLEHVVRAARALRPERIVLVVAPEAKEAFARQAGEGVSIATQDPPLGTAHAVRCGLSALEGADGDLLVLYGDGPLYTGESLERLVAHHRSSGASETLLSAVVDDPKGYGRVVLDAAGRVSRIVEELDADEQTRAIREINTGIVVFRLPDGGEALARIGNENAKGEYYLTDLVEELVRSGGSVERVLVGDPEECASFNSLEELAEVRARMRQRIVRSHQRNGVDVVDPATAYIDIDVEIGRGTTILPCCVIARGVAIGEECVVGPFTHLRVETRLERGAEVGNFVEVKKSTLGEKAKAKHLTYLGDATVGARANIGCGTITANYDGKSKHPTRIGDGAFIGSGTVLIAPTTVGAAARTGAGAIVTRGTSIEDGATYVGVPARRIGKRPSGSSTEGSKHGGGSS